MGVNQSVNEWQIGTYKPIWCSLGCQQIMLLSETKSYFMLGVSCKNSPQAYLFSFSLGGSYITHSSQ